MGKKKETEEQKRAAALLQEEMRARHSDEPPVGKVASHVPAAAALLGLHPQEGDAVDATGSPEADLERAQAEERKDDPQ